MLSPSGSSGCGRKGSRICSRPYASIPCSDRGTRTWAWPLRRKGGSTRRSLSSPRPCGSALTTSHQDYWHPLTWMSLMLDAEIGAKDPRTYHVTNLALHLVNVLLLFLALDTMTGQRLRSAVVAALFAVHPLHVESVCWITE